MAYSNPTGLPSSTQILSPFINKDYFLPEHRERGSKVHASLSTSLQGLFMVGHPQYQGYIESGLRWIESMVQEVVLVEERLVDKAMGFCGQPDLIAILKGEDQNSLVDWKTSVAPSKVWAAQIASYRLLASTDKGIQTHRGLTVLLDASGGMARAKEYTEFDRDLNVFISALNCFNAFNS